MNAVAFSSAWIDRLFMRFSVVYGKHWLDLWADVPMADVKDAWQTELAGVTGEQIAGALKNLGKFPPTLPEFIALCKPPAVQAAHRLFLPSPKPFRSEIDPKMEAEVAKVLAEPKKRDPKWWAREIMERHERGENLMQIQIDNAREALGLKAA